LAIYDWNGELTNAAFHEVARSVFEANGTLPDTCSISRFGGDHNRLREYAHVVAHLNALEGNLAFYHTIPGYTQLIFGWDIFASISNVSDKTMVICFDRQLAGIDLQYVAGIVRSLAEIVSLRYGIGYQRSFNSGPELYAFGMIAGLGYTPSERAERDRIGSWMRERIAEGRHLKGFLRDVYPLNVLSAAHLAREVENLPLSQWIEASAARGTLSALPNEAWLWTIPEQSLSLVQTTLQQAGCTIVPSLP
jgi:hypothetical protein